MNSLKKGDKGSGCSSKRGVIGLGDLMRALKGLECHDTATLEHIARSLGFTGIDANPAEEAQGVSGARRRPNIVQKKPDQSVPSYGGPLPPPLPVNLPEAILETEMTPLDSTEPPSQPPSWLDQESGLEELAHPSSSVPRTKLIRDRSAMGILSATIATRRPGAQPDVARLIEATIRGSVLRSFPYMAKGGVHRGLQLLMDTSEAMTPFLEDLDDLSQAMVRLVGQAGCELYKFKGDPHDAKRWSADFREIPWRPVAGRPVVVATDFGIGDRIGSTDRAGPRCWLAFEQRVRAAGLPLIAFVPYGREHWRKSLSRRIHLIHWDPRTRSSHITKLFGIGHEVDL
jgi:hypothetical protein